MVFAPQELGPEPSSPGVARARQGPGLSQGCAWPGPAAFSPEPLRRPPFFLRHLLPGLLLQPFALGLLRPPGGSKAATPAPQPVTSSQGHPGVGAAPGLREAGEGREGGGPGRLAWRRRARGRRARAGPQGRPRTPAPHPAASPHLGRRCLASLMSPLQMLHNKVIMSGNNKRVSLSGNIFTAGGGKPRHCFPSAALLLCVLISRRLRHLGPGLFLSAPGPR